MESLHVRVDAEVREHLEELAAREGESVAVIVRRLLRSCVREHRQSVRQLTPAHEGTERVR